MPLGGATYLGRPIAGRPTRGLGSIATRLGRPIGGLTRSYLLDRQRGHIYTPPQFRGGGTVTQPRLPIVTTPAPRPGDQAGFLRPPIVRTVMPVQVPAPGKVNEAQGQASDVLAKPVYNLKPKPSPPLGDVKPPPHEIEKLAAERKKQSSDVAGIALGALVVALIGGIL